jgi:hypothetical protein
MHYCDMLDSYCDPSVVIHEHPVMLVAYCLAPVIATATRTSCVCTSLALTWLWYMVLILCMCQSPCVVLILANCSSVFMYASRYNYNLFMWLFVRHLLIICGCLIHKASVWCQWLILACFASCLCLSGALTGVCVTLVLVLMCIVACSSITWCLQWSSGSFAKLWCIDFLYIHLSVLFCLAKWINDVNCWQLWSSYS